MFALFAPLSRISRFRGTLDFRLLDMFGRIGGQALRRAGRRPVARPRIYARNFSAQSGTSATTAASALSPLAGITSELDRIAPRFEVPASQITIIESPASFYSTLKVRLRYSAVEVHLN
jgi:CDP-diacylglycerol--glycerol-3-phosphate 3-phosphatidyltransferase